MKKAQIVDLMMKNKERFKHIKMAEKKAPAPAPAKKPTTPPPKKKKIKLNVLPKKAPPKAKKVKLNVIPKTPPKPQTPSPPKGKTPSSSPKTDDFGRKEKPRTKEQMEFIEMVRKNDDDPDFKGNKLFPYDIPKAKESAKKKIANIYKKATGLRIVYGQPIISKKLNFLIEMVFAFTDTPISKVEKIYNDYLKRVGLPPKAKTPSPPKSTPKSTPPKQVAKPVKVPKRTLAYLEDIAPGDLLQLVFERVEENIGTDAMYSRQGDRDRFFELRMAYIELRRLMAESKPPIKRPSKKTERDIWAKVWQRTI